MSTYLVKTWHRYSFLFFNLLLSVILGSSLFCSPAAAVLRQHHQAPGVLQYHAQTSLQDEQERAWQVVLFPEPQADTAYKYYLRLVAFPGLAEFEHPQDLAMTTVDGKVLFAPDAFSHSAPAPNVGQYDVTAVLPQISDALELAVPLKQQKLTLTISQTVVTEWQWLLERLARSPVVQSDLSHSNSI